MAELTHSYRPHALAALRQYRLEPDALAWSTKRRQGRVAYRDIEQIDVFQTRFLGSSSNYWTCVLHARSGGRIKLGAGHWQTFRNVEDKSNSYCERGWQRPIPIFASSPSARG